MGLSRLRHSLPVEVVQKFIQDQGPNQATLVAWNALSAMFPILIFAASILGIVLSRAGFRADQFYTDVSVLVPDQHAQAQIQQGLTAVKNRSGLFFLVGLAGMLWSGANLFGTMEGTFAIIYHTRSRGLVQQKLMAFGMIFLFTFFAGVGVLASSLLPILEHLPYVPSFLLGGLAGVLQVGVGLVAAFVLYVCIYYLVPNRRQIFHQVLPGAVVAAVLFELLTLLFPLYLSLNKGMNQYGSFFALLFVLLIFFWFLGLITVIGVEVNSVLYPVPVEQPMQHVALAPPGSGPGADPQLQPTHAAEPAPPKPRRHPRRALALLGLGVLLDRVVSFLARRRRANG